MISLSRLRADYERSSNRSMSMPIAGAVIWALVGVGGRLLSSEQALLMMLVATGLIFPLALLIARLRHEALTSATNPLSKLMLAGIIMVNLLWGVHIPLVLGAPSFAALSLGIALGLHWVIYSWVIQHPLGVTHSVIRTVLVVAAWFALPDDRLSVVPLVIVCTYLMSLVQMQMRRVPTA